MTTLNFSVSRLLPPTDHVYQGAYLWADLGLGPDGQEPDGIIYEWLSDRVVAQRGGGYQVSASDVGQTITLRALLPDGHGGYAVYAESALSLLVYDVNDQPRGTFQILPGDRAAGTVLTVQDGVTDLDGKGPVSYQWLADEQPIAGATGTSYTLATGDLDKAIVVVASYVDGLGVASTYRSDGKVAPNSAGILEVEASVAAGAVLHADVVDPDGPGPVSYRWDVADATGAWAVVAGATGPDLALGAVAPSAVRVTVDYADDRGAVAYLGLAIGSDGDDVIRMSYGEQVRAGAGDDAIHGVVGSHQVDGGAGLDTYVVADGSGMSAFLADTGIWYVRSGVLHIDAALTNVERVVTHYGNIALDIDGVAGQAYRLYQAAFDRAPDAAGLGFWIAQLDHGTTLADVANAFVASDEFRAIYGADPASATIVDTLYRHVLHREADAARQFWIDALDSGALDTGDLLRGFSESAENVAALVGTLQQGIAYTPYG